jgi:hypothetical protein
MKSTTSIPRRSKRRRTISRSLAAETEAAWRRHYVTRTLEVGS